MYLLLIINIVLEILLIKNKSAMNSLLSYIGDHAMNFRGGGIENSDLKNDDKKLPSILFFHIFCVKGGS